MNFRSMGKGLAALGVICLLTFSLIAMHWLTITTSHTGDALLAAGIAFLIVGTVLYLLGQTNRLRR